MYIVVVHFPKSLWSFSAKCVTFRKLLIVSKLSEKNGVIHRVTECVTF